MLTQLGGGRFQGYSAGSFPSGRINPYALATLEALGYDTIGMQSKSWDIYAALDKPKMDLIITLTGPGLWWSECLATFGLLAVILGCSRTRSAARPFAVAAYIVGAYWFTASTSFANPAVTLARAASDTFAGIRPIDAPAFVAAQLAGALLAAALFGWLLRGKAVPPVLMPITNNENTISSPYG